VRLTRIVCSLIALALLSAAPALADPPVQNVTCRIGDDGAGSTSAQIVAGQPVENSGADPGPASCGQAVTVAPPPTRVDGTCGPMNTPCSASGSATATASTGTSVSAQSATLTAAANGSANATTSGSSDGQAAGEQSLGGTIQFTVSVPTTFQVSGSASVSGQNTGFSGAEAGLTEDSPHFRTLLQVTRGGNSASGTLEPGTYSFGAFVEARAQANFNSSDPTTSSSHAQVTANATLTIGAPPGGCPPDAQPSVQVGLALAEGCFTERKDAQNNGTGVFETDQEAWLGGLDLKPRTGGKLVLEPANHTAPVRAEGAGVDWVLPHGVSIPAPLGEIEPFTPTYTLSLNTAGTLERVVALPLLKDTSAQVTVTWGTGGANSTIQAQVSIEDISKNLGDAFSESTVGTLSGSLTLNLANGSATSLSGASFQVPEFSAHIKDTDPALRLGFGGAKFTEADDANGKPTWSGEVTTLFPWADRQGSITGGLSVADESLAGLKLAVSGFKQPLGKSGWELTGVNGQLAFQPAFAFDLGVNVEEKVKVKGDPLFKLDGNLKGLALASDCKQGANPFEFLLSGNAPPLESEHIGKATFQVRFCAYLTDPRDFAFEAAMSGAIKVDVGKAKGLVTASGSASGWFSGRDFNLDGSYQLQLPLIGNIGAQGVLSSEGYAFCGTYHFITEGFATNNWVEPPQDLSGCDLTPFRAQPRAAASAAGARTRTVRVAGGQDVVAIAVRGVRGAPRVRLTGPRGQRVDGAHALTTSRAIVLPIAQLHTTYVYLHHPAAGTWRVRTLAGSDLIRRLDTAHKLPAPRVSAKVTVKRGRVRVSWRAKAIPGQAIELLDRAAGTATTIQKLTRRHRGRLAFTPGGPHAGRRTIEADVVEHGIPRARRVVARYRLAK
jgi:hypothetical protein